MTECPTASNRSLSPFSIVVQNPVPQPNSHESKLWYHKNLQRGEAEELLRNYKLDGSFLVRESEKEENFFSITFRTDKCIKHCRIKQEGRLFLIGNSSFTSLVELINFYQRYPLYGQTILKYPISTDNQQNVQVNYCCPLIDNNYHHQLSRRYL